MKITADAYFDKIEDIPPDYFEQNNLYGVILDIDNTLLTEGSYEMSNEVVSWIKNLSVPVCFVSNGKERRVSHFAAVFGFGYVYKAMKPFKKGFFEAAKLLCIDDLSRIAVIGDQLLTDILGGKRSGCHTIKIAPIDVSFDPLSVKIKRFLERFVS